MKKILPLLLVLFITSSCMLPLANRQMLEFNGETSNNRVTQEFQGATFLFSIIPLGDTMDIKIKLDEMKRMKGCNKRTNIDILYFNYSFLFVGFEKIRINADCIK